MSDKNAFEKELIRLGSQSPDLQPHIREVLDVMRAEASVSKVASVSGGVEMFGNSLGRKAQAGEWELYGSTKRGESFEAILQIESDGDWLLFSPGVRGSHMSYTIGRGDNSGMGRVKFNKAIQSLNAKTLDWNRQ